MLSELHSKKDRQVYLSTNSKNKSNISFNGKSNLLIRLKNLFKPAQKVEKLELKLQPKIEHKTPALAHIEEPSMPKSKTLDEVQEKAAAELEEEERRRID